MNASELRELRDLRIVEELVPVSTFKKMRGEALTGKSMLRIYPYDDCMVHKTRKDSTDSEHERDMGNVAAHLRNLGYTVETHYKWGDVDLGVSHMNVIW